MIYQAKIRVAESGDTPVLHVKIMQHLPNSELGERGPEVQAFKPNQTEDAPFNFTEENTVFNAMGFGVD